jgi:integrase
VLTPEQIQTVIRNLVEPYRTMIVVLAVTVIRECELLALKWEDVDFIGRVIRVRRSLYRGNVDEDKNTDTSTRDLPAGPVVFRFLADLRSSEHNRGEYVFMTASGTLCEPSNIRARVFHPCAEANGLPSFSFRSFRRTAATFIHNSGVPLKVQREIMGHTEEEMSLVYSEAEVSLQRKTLEDLEQRMFGGLVGSEKPSCSVQ